MIYANRFFKRSGFLVYSITNLIYDSSELRIVNFFKSFARDYGHDISGIPGLKCIPILLTNLEIATLTSTSPEKVGMVINDLIEKGMIRMSDDKLLIKIEF